MKNIIENIIKTIKKKYYTIKMVKRKHSNIHMFFTFASLVMIWRGIRLLLDMYLLPGYPLLNVIIPIIVGIVYLLWDDNKLKELTK